LLSNLRALMSVPQHFRALSKSTSDFPPEFVDVVWMWPQLRTLSGFKLGCGRLFGIGRGPCCMSTTTAPICTPRTLSVVQTSMPWCHGSAILGLWHLFCGVLYSRGLGTKLDHQAHHFVTGTTKIWLLCA
jgi:hypothetical protein